MGASWSNVHLVIVRGTLKQDHLTRCRGISNDATTPLHHDNRHIIDARGFISDHKYKYRIGGCLLIAILRLGVGERARAATELLRDWGEFSE